MSGQPSLHPNAPQGRVMGVLGALNKSVDLPKSADDESGFCPADRRNPIDIHVGSRIRLRRTLMGMSQERLGEAIGLTFQQVQKYERGVNRVSASRLFEVAQVLDVPISFFYDDMSEAGVRHVPQGPAGFSDCQDGFTDDTLNRRETLELVRAYYRIADADVRKRMFDLIKSLAPTPASSPG